MEVPNQLVKAFSDLVNEKEEKKENIYAYGVAKKDAGKMYVMIDGSSVNTPVRSTSDANDGDRVMVMVKNHEAIIMGNETSPAARTDDVKANTKKVTEFEEIVADKVVSDDIEAYRGWFEELTAITGQFEDLNAYTARIEELKAQYASLDHVTAKDIEAMNAVIDSLRAEFGEFSELSAEQLEAGKGIFDDIEAHNGHFTTVSADELKAQQAYITEIQSKMISADTVRAIVGEFNYLTADQANLTYATITDLTANYITSQVIESEYARLDKANIGAGWIDTAMIGDGVVGTAQIADASITDGKIVELSASKLTAGIIDASVIEVTNLNADNITVGTINGKQIAPGAIDFDNLDADVTASITEAKLTAESVKNSAVYSTKVEYALSTSSTVAPSSGWSIIAPPWEDGKYMWQRTTTIYGNGTEKVSDPTCISGATGPQGTQGINLALKTGTPITLTPLTLDVSGAAANYRFATYWFANDMTLTKNKDYTVSFDVKITAGSFTSMTVLLYTTDGKNDVNVTGKIVNNRVICTAKTTTAIVNRLLIYAGVAGSTAGNGCIISHVKLEEGVVSNPVWTPALQDLESEGIYYRDDAPAASEGLKEGDTWFDTNDGNKVYSWNGSSWVARQFGTNAIANASITNALIKDATIEAAKINSVNADKITTGTLNAARIGAGTINADKLAANAVTAGKIAANAVTAGNIQAGAIGTDKLAANAVTADKLYVGLGGNLLSDYDTFEQITDSTIYCSGQKHANITPSIDTTQAYYGSRCLKLVRDSTAYNSWVRLRHPTNSFGGLIRSSPGKMYVVSLYAKGSTTVSFNIWIEGYNSSYAVTDLYTSPAKSVGTSWTRFEWPVFTHPSTNTAQIYIGLAIGVSTVSSTLWVDAIQVEEVTSTTKKASPFKPSGATVINGGTIVTGSITAGKLAANAVEANNIKAGAVTAGKIAANAVEAGNIKAGAVTADKISTTSLSAITANLGTLTAGVIQSPNFAMSDYKPGASGSTGTVKNGLKIDLTNMAYYTPQLTMKNNYIDLKGYMTIGSRSGTVAEFTFVQGYNNVADGTFAFAQGRENTATGIHSHAEGREVNAIANHSHAEGYKTWSQGEYSHAEGDSSRAGGTGSHAEGYSGSSVGKYSHAEGYSCTANKDYSHAEGNKTIAGAIGAHSEGLETKANGDYSISAGYKSIASGQYATAIGFATTASMDNAFAHGYGTKASGSASHAEGNVTVASGDYSHASGFGTIAASQSQTAIGKYNVSDSAGLGTSAFIIGGGSSDSARKNIFTVDWKGNVTAKSFNGVLIQRGTVTPPNSNGFFKIEVIKFPIPYKTVPEILCTIKNADSNSISNCYTQVVVGAAGTAGFQLKICSPQGDIGSSNYTASWVAFGTV